MKNNKAIKIIAVALVAVILLAGLHLGVAAVIYEASFGYRIETPEQMRFSEEQFPDLIGERHSFTSDKGQTLVGYLYERADSGENQFEGKALIIFAHGFGGGGQVGYMDIFDYLTGEGFYVFAYDATGNDESEGDKIGGLPQGYIDLSYAIEYAKNIEKTAGLPTVLMGYSWGGLSVGNVLNYQPDVAAVVSIAGWNRSMDMMEHVGYRIAGEPSRLLLPFLSAYEHLLFGDYADADAIGGFERSDCPVMIIHGRRDTTVPIAFGYEEYQRIYAEDERFSFVEYENLDHTLIRNPDGSLNEELFSTAVDFVNQAIK